jgi:hypothetical protein
VLDALKAADLPYDADYAWKASISFQGYWKRREPQN